MRLSELLEFKGKWRTYQARVLKRADSYLKDGKIHIVAAPGSGKTTLGIELIRKLNRPALVLAPSVTIREQWVARIKEAFLRAEVEPDQYFSQNLKEPKLITVATYQALHSAMTRFSGTIADTQQEKDTEGDDESASVKEAVDFSDFNLIETMQAAGIGTLCLDECHHLRSEWWKALEDFRKQIGTVKTIALTATPPYDSTPAMWKRYLDMCGDMDEEITIPELVKEGSLCPHQDFVYFNYPTEVEEAQVKKYEERSRQVFSELMQDKEFASVIATHSCLTQTEQMDVLLDKPAYFSSLLIFLQAKNIPFSKELRSMIGTKKLPDMNLKWMQELLQGMLYEDAASYICDNVYRQQLEAKLKREGLIEKKKVALVANQAVQKMLTRSKGKCESIRNIVRAEYEAMGAELRQLILTDYIRKEYESVLGNPEADVMSLGVLPFFEMLRRDNEGAAQGPKLGILCGTLVVIPADQKEVLLHQLGNSGRVTFSSIGAIPETAYVKVNPVGDAHFLTGAITELFTGGGIQVLIGTKSLLGEGWDSPCINSLIMASFVGSYMLSNQMRGRAIRVFKEKPEKTSNIWHLVCLKPDNLMDKEEGLGEDMELLDRRMEHFLGLHYTEDVIENGTERLSYIKYPLTKATTTAINQKMLALSTQRDLLRERWMKSLEVYEQIEIAEETAVTDEQLPAVVFFDALKREIIYGILCMLLIVTRAGMGRHPLIGFVLGVALFCLLVMMLIKLPKLLTMGSPLKRLGKFGQCILRALQKKKLISESNVRVKTDSSRTLQHFISLKGGSSRDKNIFVQSVSEFFDEIDNQRYLLVCMKKRKTMDGYFCVPDALAKNKEDAQLLAECMKPCLGSCEVVYTRNAEGRKLLMEGRIHALANRQNRCITHKRVKSALE